MKRRTPLYIILSVLTGIGCSILIFFILIAFSIGLGLFGWSDGGEKRYLERLEFTTHISLIVAVVAALGGGIFMIYRMNKPQKENDSFQADDP
jgi:Flp pilus assembly protein protease CpaA